MKFPKSKHRPFGFEQLENRNLLAVLIGSHEVGDSALVSTALQVTPVVTPAIKVTALTALVTTENGGKAQFSVQLTTKPTSTVTIPVVSADTTEGTVSVKTPLMLPLKFTTSNWNVPQTVTVTGKIDTIFDGPVAYKVNLGAAVSTDLHYKGKTASVSLTNKDRSDVARFDGTYMGTYDGMVSGFQVSGTVKVTVKNGKVTVTDPGQGTGSISATGSAVFGVSSGQITGGSFKGTIAGVLNKSTVNGNGTWSYNGAFGTGSGTWKISRV